jgi:hypothetical protein
MGEKGGSQIPVARTEFDDGERSFARCRLVALRHLFEIVCGERMSEPVISGRKRLIEIADLIAAKTVKELINVGLPLIDGFPIADQLR